MNTTFQSLLFEVDEQGICTISINRPEKLNALNNQVFLDLDDALTAADQNPEIRVVIVTGVGEKAFVAGADIKEFAELPRNELQIYQHEDIGFFKKSRIYLNRLSQQ